MSTEIEKRSSGTWSEMEFNKATRPYCREIVTEIVFLGSVITRDFEEEREGLEPHILDQEYGIDFQLRMLSGLLHTLQRKILGIDKQHHQSMTWEYMNNPEKGIEGDFFKWDSNFYIFGYANVNYPYKVTEISQWVVYRLDCLKKWIESIGGAEELIRKGWLKRNNPKKSKSNFFAIPFKEIPQNCIEAERKLNGLTYVRGHIFFR